MANPNHAFAAVPVRDVPVSVFAAVMGVAGLGLAWRQASLWPGAPGCAPGWIGETLICAAAVLFVIIAVAYAVKIFRTPGLALAEWRDPRRINFFACVPLSLMLLSAGALPFTRPLALLLWIVGAAMQFVLALIVLARPLAERKPDHEASPSLFLPLAGIVIGPVTGMPLGYIAISWLMLLTGSLLWLRVCSLLLDRTISGARLRPDEWPLLAILITPSALAFMSYMALTHYQIDAFARILFWSAVLFLLLNLALAGIYRRLPYSLAWWAFTFPSGAMATAAMQYHAREGVYFPAAFCVALLALASVLVLYNIVQSVRGLRAGALLARRQL